MNDQTSYCERLSNMGAKCSSTNFRVCLLTLWYPYFIQDLHLELAERRLLVPANTIAKN